MANRRFSKGIFHLSPGLVDLNCKVVFASSSGAATMTYGKGIASCTKATTGRYTFVLDDKYSRFVFADAILEASTVPSVAKWVLHDEHVNESTKTIIMQAAGNGATVKAVTSCTGYFHFRLDNTSNS